MKIDRFSAVASRAAAALLAGFLLACLPAFAASGGSLRIGRWQVNVESSSKQMAKALALQAGVVGKRFEDNRRALTPARGADGKPAFLRQDVARLITRTGEELDQAIVAVEPAELEPLRAWAAEEMRRIEEALPAPARKASLGSPGFPLPRAIAVAASLRELPRFLPAKGKPAAPKPETIPAGTADGLLDQVGEVVSRVFLLASRDDLKVKLWVGSTPAPKVVFSFWPQGRLKGTTPEDMTKTIRTNDKREVVRGLYSYKAAWAKGPVTELVVYPSPAGTPATQLPGERLDLVKEPRFFCCRFDEHRCHHVDKEKDCRP